MFSRHRIWRIIVVNRPILLSVAVFAAAMATFAIAGEPEGIEWGFMAMIATGMSWALFELGITAKQRKKVRRQEREEAINRMEGQH